MRYLLLDDLFLGAVGTDNVGVVHLGLQIAGDIVDVDPAELGALFQFSLGQAFGLVLGGQFVDSCDDFIDVHIFTSHIAMNCYGNTVFFRPAVNGYQFDFAKTPDGYLHTFGNGFVGLFTG